MRIPMMFWENFELFAMFALLAVVFITIQAGGSAFGIALMIFGMVFLVVGKPKAFLLMVAHCEGCLSANIVSEGEDNKSIAIHLDLFFNDSSAMTMYDIKGFQTLDIRECIMWTKEYFLNRMTTLLHHSIGNCRSIMVQYFGPPLTDSDYGQCQVSLLATGVEFNRTAVVTLFDKNIAVMGRDLVKVPFYGMESAKSRYPAWKKAPLPVMLARPVN